MKRAFLQFMVRWVLPGFVIRFLTQRRWIHWSQLFSRGEAEQRLQDKYGEPAPSDFEEYIGSRTDWSEDDMRLMYPRGELNIVREAKLHRPPSKDIKLG